MTPRGQALEVTAQAMVAQGKGVLAADESNATMNKRLAERTLSLFRRFVPAAVPGIAFLSGGQSDESATQHLNAMNVLGGVPWELSFSFGRALQATPLKIWAGQEANVDAAQAALAHRARCNAEARSGRYSQDLEGTTSSAPGRVLPPAGLRAPAPA